MKSGVNFFNNDEGVSPIVATLVLIVVAIIGAAAVGLIMGSFSTSVSNTANSNNVSSGASTTVLIGGSTTMYPGDVILAKDYMNSHEGIQINNQQGGSDAGIAGVGMGALDIGAASRAVSSADLTKYPNLQSTEVAGSAVAVIYNNAGTPLTGTAVNIDAADLKTLYTAGTIGGTIPAGVTAVVQRQDGSGTEETFAKWLTNGAETNLDSHTFTAGAGTSYSDAEVGNEGVLAKVQTTPHAIGFVDWGYVNTATKLGTNVQTLGIIDDASGSTTPTTYAPPTSTSILNALKGQTGQWVPGLVKHCYLITNGQPNPIIKAFIQYAQSPAGSADFQAAGMFGVTQYA